MQEYFHGLRAAKGEEGNTDPLVCFNKAIQLDPRQSSFYRTRADYYCGKGDFQMALADFDRAISLSPQWYYLYYDRGLCQCRLHNFDQALADFEIAIKGQPSNLQFYSGMALAYLCQDKLDEALVAIDKALANHSPFVQWHYQRGIILSRLGKHAEAVAEFSGTRAVTIVGEGNKQRHVYYDGEREFAISKRLSQDELLAVWSKPPSLDYYSKAAEHPSEPR